VRFDGECVCLAPHSPVVPDTQTASVVRDLTASVGGRFDGGGMDATEAGHVHRSRRDHRPGTSER